MLDAGNGYVSNDRKNYTSQAIFRNRNFRYRDVDPLRALLEEEIVTADRISLDRINFNSGNESLTLLLTFNITSSREFLFNSVTIFQLAFENSFDSIITETAYNLKRFFCFFLVKIIPSSSLERFRTLLRR